jgi:hypothetical protein
MPWRAGRLFLIIMAAIIGIVGGLSTLALSFEPEPLAPPPHEIHETNLLRVQDPPHVLSEPQIVVRLVRN